jgi:hypothetical protein
VINHEQIEKEIQAQITDAVDILDMLAGYPQGVTNQAHRVLVEKIISAALLQTALTQAKAMSAGKGGEE